MNDKSRTFLIAQLLLLLHFISPIAEVSGQNSMWYSGTMLSNTQIHCIVEDSQGFMWIGTENGLNKFDGYKFSFLFHDDSEENSLSSNYVRCMACDNNGMIWVGTSSMLQLMDPKIEVFRNVIMPSTRSFFINKILIRSNEEVWFLASGAGVFRISDREELKAERVEWINKAIQGAVNYSSIIEDSHGIVWVGTDIGVFRCNPVDMSVTQLEADVITANVSGLSESKNGNIIISTRSRLYEWLQNDNMLIELPVCRSNRNITHLFSDRNAGIYAAVQGEGLRIFDESQEKFEQYDDFVRGEDINHLDISAFYMDSHGNRWLGCYLSGLMLIHDGQSLFRSWRFQDYYEYTGGSMTDMLVDHDGNLWVCYNNCSLTCFDRDGNIIRYLQNQQLVNSLFQAEDGTIWAGLFFGGIARVNTLSDILEPVIDDYGNASVPAITQDTSGRLYFSIYGQGLGIYNPETGITSHWSSATESDNHYLGNDRINALTIDNRGILWIGHNSGVSCYDTNRDVYIAAPRFLSPSGIICYTILCDSVGQVWAGTDKGIYRYNTRTRNGVHITSDNGLSNDYVCGLEMDSEGNIWCSTANGLNRINNATMQIDRFFSGSGLLEKNYYQNACSINRMTGTLYFGSSEGIVSFDAKNIINQGYVGNVTLTALLLNREPVTTMTMSGRRRVIDEPVTTAHSFYLANKDNHFTMELSNFDYGNQDCISYEYSIDGYTWDRMPAGVNRITFTNFAYGNHEVMVRAFNNNVLSDISSWSFRIGRPWYLSLWAIALYIMIFLSAVTVYMYQARQKREKELSEIKLQSFTNVAHELCSPLTMVISPIEELMRKKEMDADSIYSLKLMRRNSSRILNLLTQLLDIRRFDEGQMNLKCRETDMVQFVREAFEMFSYAAEQHRIRYSFDSSTKEIFTWIDRDRIEKVLSNLLSNAIKYTHDDGDIMVNVTNGTDESKSGALRHYVEVSVTDSGIGLDMNDVEKVFDRFYRANNTMTSVTLGLGIGLNYSRILVEMHHGEIHAMNRQDGQGSRFWFRLPLGNEHLKEEEICKDNDFINVFGDVEDVIKDKEPDRRYAGAARGYKVLVIDDDESMLEYISHSLRTSYYNVILCRNGKEGLSSVLLQKPDIIVSDVVMPEMDGISLVKALKSNPNVSHIPIILLSARNKLHDRMEGIETGADAYLPKPFYMEELKLQIQNLINNRLIVKGKFSGEQDQKNLVENLEVESIDDALMKRIMEVINRNLSNPDFSVEHLCDAVGVSRTQLHRKLKNITGLSAGRFIHNIRMQQAATLLKQNGSNIAEVADMVGFNTRTHFATAFKTHYGMTPSEYIRKHRTDAKGDSNLQIQS